MMWDLDPEEDWAPKNWCFQTMVLKILESPFARRSNWSIIKGINPEHSLEGLMLNLQLFSHLMQTANSLEKTLMLGKIEGRRRSGQQRMRWLDSIIDSMKMLLLLLSRFSRVQPCDTLWTAAHQTPLSTGFSRQEYWSGLPFPSLEGRGRQKEKVTLFY